MGATEPFLSYWRLKLKLWVFVTDWTVDMVKLLVKFWKLLPATFKRKRQVICQSRMDNAHSFYTVWYLICILLSVCSYRSITAAKTTTDRVANNISRGCPDNMSGTTNKETHLEKCDVEIENGNKNEMGIHCQDVVFNYSIRWRLTTQILRVIRPYS